MTNFKPYSKAKKRAIRVTKKRLLTAEQQLSAVAARVDREDSLVYLDDQYITILRNMADVLSAVRKGIK